MSAAGSAYPEITRDSWCDGRQHCRTCWSNRGSVLANTSKVLDERVDMVLRAGKPTTSRKGRSFLFLITLLPVLYVRQSSAFVYVTLASHQEPIHRHMGIVNRVQKREIEFGICTN